MATFLRSRATISTNAGTDTALLTYYWDSTGAAPTALATEAHARVRAFWEAVKGLVPSTSSLTITAEVDEIEETTGQIVGQIVGTLPAAVTFSSALEYLPLQTQALMSLNTGTFIAGRRLKGRQFLPGMTEGSNTSGGNVAAATLTTLGTGATALSTTVVTAMNQRVWHRPQGGTGGLSAIVTSRVINPRWAVLKSRRGG